MSFLRLNMSKRAKDKDKTPKGKETRRSGRSNSSVVSTVEVEEGAALTLTTSVEPAPKKQCKTKTSGDKKKCFPTLAVVLNNVVNGKPETRIQRA